MGNSDYLLHGTLDFLVLKALAWGEMHGFGVARWIERITEDVLTVEEGSLYPALHRLERDGLVSGRWGVSQNNRRARFYRITPAGEKQLRATYANWSRFAAAIEKVAAAQPTRRGPRPA